MDKESSPVVLEGQVLSGGVLESLEKYRLVFCVSPAYLLKLVASSGSLAPPLPEFHFGGEVKLPKDWLKSDISLDFAKK
jgi:hypothetical protein